MEDWPYRRGVQLDLTRPGEPTDNGHIESFDGRLREECLNVQPSHSLAPARQKPEAWRRDYNQVRPDSAPGDLTPRPFCIHPQGQRAAEAARL